MSYPSVDDINRIVRLADPVVRNFQITQCYFEISRALRMLIRANANWCAFATWASKPVMFTGKRTRLAEHRRASARFSLEWLEKTSLRLARRQSEHARARVLPIDSNQVSAEAPVCTARSPIGTTRNSV